MTHHPLPIPTAAGSASCRSSIMERKERYETFTKKAIRSEEFRGFVKNNRSYRHLFRFFVNIFMFFILLIAAYFLFERNVVIGGLFFPIYLFVQGLVVSGFIIHAHEFTHRHIKSKWLNDLMGILSAAMTFVNFYSFQRAHSLHHANIGNLDAPEAGAPVSPKGQEQIRHGDRTRNLAKKIAEKSPFLWIFVAWPIFVFDGDYNSWIMPFSNKDRMDRKSIGVFGAVLIAHLAFLVVFPWAYLGLYLPAMLIGGNRFIAITYLHHAHEGAVFFDENHHNFYNVIMANTDRDFGPIVNFFMMNNGYHVAHHLNPQIAYYDLRRASDYLRSIFPDDLPYPYLAGGRLYRDLARGKYDQRISKNAEFYELTWRH